jgi:hypothetical protein
VDKVPWLALAQTLIPAVISALAGVLARSAARRRGANDSHALLKTALDRIEVLHNRHEALRERYDQVIARAAALEVENATMHSALSLRSLAAPAGLGGQPTPQSQGQGQEQGDQQVQGPPAKSSSRKRKRKRKRRPRGPSAPSDSGAPGGNQARVTAQ